MTRQNPERRRTAPTAALIAGVLTLAAVLPLAAGCAPAPARPAAHERVDHRPPRPHPHSRWVEGHWTYEQGRYHWVRGSWAR